MRAPTGEVVYAPGVGGSAGVLRAGLRVVALLLVCTVAAIVYSVGCLVLALCRGPVPAWRRACVRAWGRSTCHLVGLSVDRTGLPPRRASLIVSNHVSYIDIPLLAAWTGGRFVSKSEVARWPLIGGLARLGGTMFVTRGSARDVTRLQGQIRRAVDQGDCVVMFPEGTSTRGDRVLPFRSALLGGGGAGAGVNYVTLGYSVGEGLPDAGMAVGWTGQQELAPHLWRLLCLPGFQARVVFGRSALIDHDRRVLASRLHDRVAGQHRQMLAARCPWKDARVSAGEEEPAAEGAG